MKSVSLVYLCGQQIIERQCFNSRLPLIYPLLVLGVPFVASLVQKHLIVLRPAHEFDPRFAMAIAGECVHRYPGQ